jgi:perosamine synthetase
MHRRNVNTRGPASTSPVDLPSDRDASGRSFGPEELARVAAVLESGTLTATAGAQTPELEADFGALLGVQHVVACSSGTAAVHAAIAAVDPDPGDEIITTSITDMGAIAPILYQGAIPMFADVEPTTGNVTAATVEAVLSDRTKAIIVTHLFGLPAEVDAITAIADARGIPVIEDCAQAFLAERGGRKVGTFGAVNAFSLQQGKHITTGEGGLVAGDDDHFARRARLFVNKGWPYGESGPDHEFLAINSRISELQAAVANAQLEKLAAGVAQRIAMADRLTEQLTDVPGIETPPVPAGDRHVYWKYCLRVDPEVVAGGPPAIAAELKLGGIASAPRYIQKPAFRCAVIRDQVTFGSSHWPFDLARPEAVDYDEARFPGTFDMLDRVLVLPFNERYEEQHVDHLAKAIRASVESLVGGRP